MATIAQAAGVSRPALYQYFTDKDDIFAAAFAGVFERRVDKAIASLQADGTLHFRVDGMLQRFDGDLWKQTASLIHHDELMQAKSPAVAAAVAVEVDRLWQAVAAFLKTQHPGRSNADQARRAEWLDLLQWSPRGLRFDEPDIETYRQRLTALARSVSSDIAAA